MQLDSLCGVIATGALLISVPGTVVLAILSLAGLLRSRRKTMRRCESRRLAVVVPAHNEEQLIARCVRSLQSCRRPTADVEIIVVADNCTDGTAEIAARMDARVLRRDNDAVRGKGAALQFAFERLRDEGFGRFVVVDGDSVVDETFLVEMEHAFDEGADAVQCRYLVFNVQSTERTRLMHVALMAFNVLRPRGRDRLGLSCGILGNGFGLTRETLRAVPYNADSIVEDLEYHLNLVTAGRKVQFVDTTTVYGEIPTSKNGVRAQRARWEGGRLRFLRERGLSLLSAVFRGDLRLLEPLMDLMLLPLAFHASFLLVGLLSPIPSIRVLAAVSVLVLVIHVTGALRVGRATRGDWLALLRAPIYVAWKLNTIPSLFSSSRSGAAWIRSDRSVVIGGGK